LPFAENEFDVASVTYGIRNFEDLEKGLSEIKRVLNKDGMLVILETSVPDSFILRQGYAIHTKVILPLIGKLFSKDKRAYSYLSESANTFPYGEKLKLILEKVGYNRVEVIPQAKGLSTIYKAFK
jgi:demethylmenaquinone methyltransferase/2-methoxy-6-polyprenyl-1,4-benzoquinol methylase